MSLIMKGFLSIINGLWQFKEPIALLLIIGISIKLVRIGENIPKMRNAQIIIASFSTPILLIAIGLAITQLVIEFHISNDNNIIKLYSYRYEIYYYLLFSLALGTLSVAIAAKFRTQHAA